MGSDPLAHAARYGGEIADQGRSRPTDQQAYVGSIARELLSHNFARSQRLAEGIDYTVDPLGRLVFTSAYLLKRGECCGNKCRNCPYGWKNVPANQRIKGERMPPLDERR